MSGVGLYEAAFWRITEDFERVIEMNGAVRGACENLSRKSGLAKERNGGRGGEGRGGVDRT